MYPSLTMLNVQQYWINWTIVQSQQKHGALICDVTTNYFFQSFLSHVNVWLLNALPIVMN